VRIQNIGSRPGQEVIQLYLHDVVASVARPVIQLTGFARVHLAAGQTQEVTFTVHADRTAYTNRDLQRVVEPGDIDVLVGTSAMHLPCRARIRLTGPMRVVGHDRRLVTPVNIRPVGGS
jgi:beta-glucosidase